MSQPPAPLPDAPEAPFPAPALVAIDAAAAGTAAVLMLLVHVDGGGLARLVLALAFVSFVPGWALLDHLPLADGWSRVALAVAASLTVCTAAATGMAWLDQWQPTVLLDVLAGLSLLAIAASRVWRKRDQRAR